MISDYQKEQLEALLLVRAHLDALSGTGLDNLEEHIKEYIKYREDINKYLTDNFENICTRRCYRSRRSACCTKEGIITFFADVVINALVSDVPALDRLSAALQQNNDGYQCVYLGENGCMWRLKPIVCEMFLCDQAEEKVFGENPRLEKEWRKFKEREKSFRWPDRPVLFDDIEAIFMDAGHASSLMYLHNSPGLLRIKKQAGV